MYSLYNQEGRIVDTRDECPADDGFPVLVNGQECYWQRDPANVPGGCPACGEDVYKGGCTYCGWPFGM